MDLIKVNNNFAKRVIARYHKHFADSFKLLAACQKGLNAEAVLDFISVSRLPNSDVGYLLNKSVITLTRHEAYGRLLNATTSEKLLCLFALYERGISVFGSVDEFNSWLAMPAFGLGQLAPLSMLNTINGIQLVANELGRIEHGDLA